MAVTLSAMTRQEAEREAERLRAEHPDRETHRFLARERDRGSWTVIKVGLPPLGDLTAETRAEEKPPTADDPRTVSEQNMGPNVGPGIL
jgi:hypothetical protein